MTCRTVNLALQGGGAHGAFTWGTLDRLLEETDIRIEGISATSAGAMNAAALKSGWVAGGNEGARESLDRFWLGIAGLSNSLPDQMFDLMRMMAPSPEITARALELNPVIMAGEAMTRVLSPYQLNPLNHHPLRSVVDEMMNFTSICSDAGPKLFITATHVRTGKPKVFSGAEITTDAILASACLPTLYQAIEIVDPDTGKAEAYWDGGYMGNPALFPLFYNTTCSDILIVHINPLEREDVPYTAPDILNRINEISFNASLLRELRNIDFVNRMIEDGTIRPDAMKRNFVHSVRDDDLMSDLGIATKMTVTQTLLLQLKEAGRVAMDKFLETDGQNIGRRSSVDLRAMFS